MKFLNAKDCVSIDIMMTTNITETDVRKRQDDDLPQLGPMKFGMFNYTSKNVRPQDLSRTAKTTLGNGVRESILPPDYVAFPDEAMTRFRQERGFPQASENRQGSQTCGCVPRGSTSGYGSQCSEGGAEDVG
jgi:hypothetical protein